MKRILISLAVVLVTALSVVLIVSATNASENKKAKTEVAMGSCCDTAKAAATCDKTASKQAGCCDSTAAKQAGCDQAAAKQAGCCDQTKCDPATCTKADCNHGVEACDKAKGASASAASASAEAKPCATKCGGH